MSWILLVAAALGCERSAGEYAQAALPELSTPVEGASQERSELCLRLESPRDTVHFGEPIHLLVLLENCSEVDQKAMDLLAPEFGFLSLWIQSPAAERPKRYSPYASRDGRGRSPEILKPGESLYSWVGAYVDRDGWTLDDPGSYRFQGEYALANSDSVPLRSEPLSIKVLPPESDEDRRAAELLMRPEASFFFALGAAGGSFEEGRSLLATIARESGKTRIAPYAELGLARPLTEKRFDETTKSFREADCEGALPGLRRALRGIADPPLAAQATRLLSNCLRAMGRPDEASKVSAELFEIHPEYRRLPGIAELLKP